MKTILSQNQQKLLKLLVNEEILHKNFYFTGGTALAEYYLHHRLSEDLDFFSENEVDFMALIAIFNKIKKKLELKNITNQTAFNRNLFFFELPDGDVIKTEFTYYPFPRFEQTKKIDNMYVDSIHDIATNKLFTIYQNPRTRDFIDLYLILQKYKELSFEQLIKDARVKFDWNLDFLQLGTQLQKVQDIKDYPRMIVDIRDSDWQEFFLQKSLDFKKQIIK